jgi:hypothetical protein
MRVFLRYVNPVLAVLVLVICLVAASTERRSDRLTYWGFFKDPIQVYFLGKGIFCSAALFLLGKLVEQVMLLAASVPSRQPQHSSHEAEGRGRAPGSMACSGWGRHLPSAAASPPEEGRNPTPDPSTGKPRKGRANHQFSDGGL